MTGEVDESAIPTGYISRRGTVEDLGLGLSKDVVFGMALRGKAVRDQAYMAYVDNLGFIVSKCFHVGDATKAIGEFVSTLKQVTKTQCESSDLPGKRIKFKLGEANE